MPQNTAPSSSTRRPWGLRGLLLAAALVGLAFLLLRHGVVSPARALGGPPAAARAPRSPRPVDVALRRHAGVTGHVLDPAGQPVPAASVCAWASIGRGLVTAQTRAPRCTKTDKAGAYALTDLFPATPLVVSASAATFRPVGYRAPNGDGDLRLAEGEQRAGVDLVLRSGGVALKGSVSDVTGGGVAGAVVVSEDGPDRTLAMSDPQGEFTLWVEPGPARVTATAAGYAPGSATGPAPEHFFKIHLVPGATLVGRAVLAGSATPVAGVMIDAIQIEGGGDQSWAQTNDEGRFQVEGLSPGRYRVEATSEGREGYSKSSTTLAMGETSAEVLIELDPAYVVRGRVVDKATGEPCHDGTVTITDRKQNEFSRATVEPDGWARMASVIPGTYRVAVVCKDHIDREDYPEIAIKDGDAPPLTWEVDRGEAVRVLVVDARGRPVTKATVMAFSSGPGATVGVVDQVEADGAFHVSGLKPGDYNVSVNTANGDRQEQQVTVSLGREEHLTLTLAGAGSIEGIVEDDAHHPVPNVQITAQGAGFASARSLDDGTFSMTGLPSGDYELRAEARSGRRGATETGVAPVKVTVTAPDPARATVTVGSRNGTIEGRVTDGTEKPVTDAFIEVALSDGGPGVSRYVGSTRAPVVTDTEGRFTIDGLADGAYDVRAYRSGGSEANAVGVKLGTRDLALKLADGGSISGALTARNAPVERFSVNVRETKTSFYRSELFFHAQGLFVLHDLPAGTYEIDADTPSGRATAEVTLAEGEQKTGVALTLALRGTVEGRLVDLESGAPVAGKLVRVDGSSSAAIMSGDDRNPLSGADGRFHLEDVLPGTWSLSVMSSGPGGDMVRLPITVPDGGGTVDVGAVRLARPRVAPGEPRGNLGLYVNQMTGTTNEVGVAFGAAAEAGIEVGDVVVSVDGFDVQGPNQHLFAPLTTVPAGRSVNIGLARGTTVSVVARD
jgi:protocatechuate 3,4-dioxygenase beta subunit